MGWYYDMDECDYKWNDNHHYGKKGNKIVHDPTKHYPNKDEASLLRKIKSDTGLSEKEIREHKRYRVMLSEAQKRGEKPLRSEVERFYGKLIRNACQNTKLAKEHPKTLIYLDVLIEERFKRNWWLPVGIKKIPAKQVVKLYKKIS